MKFIVNVLKKCLVTLYAGAFLFSYVGAQIVAQADTNQAQIYQATPDQINQALNRLQTQINQLTTQVNNINARIGSAGAAPSMPSVPMSRASVPLGH